MTILLAARYATGKKCFVNCRVHHLRAADIPNLDAVLAKAEELGCDLANADSEKAACLVLDRDSLSLRQFQSLVSELGEAEGVCWSVLDRTGKIKDPGELFFAGASDFLAPAAAEKGAGPGRFEKVKARFLSVCQGTGRLPGPPDKALKPEKNKPGFPGWKNVREGQHYSFLFLYADLPEADSIRRTLGENRYIRLKEDFVSSINKLVLKADGRVWMNSGHSVLALLPPQNTEKIFFICIETLTCSSLFLYEQLGLTAPTSISFSLHYGDSIWQKPGETGHIVSEDVNFIHHLGHKYADKNRVSISGEAYGGLGKRARFFLKQKGVFENRSVYCSKKIFARDFTGYKHR